MKFLTLLLAIYFFALNFYPCGDVIVDHEDIKVEISFDHNTEHEHCDLDLCSPFCQCHCCHVHTSDLVFHHYSILKFPYSKSIFGHFEKINEGATFKLLQPPRRIG